MALRGVASEDRREVGGQRLPANQHGPLSRARGGAATASFTGLRPKLRDTLSLEIPVEADGQYEVFGKFTRAEDYGRVKLELDGKPLLRRQFD